MWKFPLFILYMLIHLLLYVCCFCFIHGNPVGSLIVTSNSTCSNLNSSYFSKNWLFFKAIHFLFLVRSHCSGSVFCSHHSLSAFSFHSLILSCPCFYFKNDLCWTISLHSYGYPLINDDHSSAISHLHYYTVLMPKPQGILNTLAMPPRFYWFKSISPLP